MADAAIEVTCAHCQEVTLARRGENYRCGCGRTIDTTNLVSGGPPLPAALVQLGEVKQVHLKLNRTGHGCKLLFDGVEQANVWSVQVQAEVHGVTSVVVGFYPAEVTIEGEAGDVVKVDCSRNLQQLLEQAFARGMAAGSRRG